VRMIRGSESHRNGGSPTTLKAGPRSDAARALPPSLEGETPVQVISVNVGLPREVIWKGMTVQTGIFKDPVNGPVTVKKLNLAGDQQADLTVHGGAEKAVYAYPAEHYEYWRKKLPEVPFTWGKFGENLTTGGLAEDTLCIGDRLRVGSAILMVTQPRMPCYKLALRFDRDDMIRRFLMSQRSGFYFSVIEEGKIQAGSKIEIVSRDPNRVAVVDIVRLYLRQTRNPELLHRTMNVGALPQNWKAELAARADHA
jgi:MOSC domain-containing protein YiiM